MRAEVRRKFAILGVGLAWALLAPGVSNATSFNPELWELTGGPTRNVYSCTLCTFEQYLAAPLPGPNWDRNASEGNPRVFLPDAGTNVPPMAPPGTAMSLDLVPEIEGDDHFLIARVLGATFLGFGAQGIMANVQVARGTTMTFSAGRVIHTLTSTDGVEYVLFSMSEIPMATFDPFVLNGLAGISVPTGWTYSSEVTFEDLVVGTPSGIANVFSVPDYWTWQEIVIVPVIAVDIDIKPGSDTNPIQPQHSNLIPVAILSTDDWTWQEIVIVPEPSTGLLVGLGLVVLTGRRRAG